MSWLHLTNSHSEIIDVNMRTIVLMEDHPDSTATGCKTRMHSAAGAIDVEESREQIRGFMREDD